MVTESQPIYKLIPGNQVQSYLHQYAEKHDLLSKIRFGTKVIKAERKSNANGGWSLHTNQGDMLECEKLIVATGLHSKPYWPAIPRDDDYSGFVIHSKSLGQEHHRLTTDKIRNVVIVGGCKSAIEAANICLATGKHVHWVVRQNAQGVPMIIVDPNMKPNLISVNNTRLFSTFSPPIFATSGFWHRLLHSGSWFLGSVLFWLFWNLLSYVVTVSAGYGKSGNGRKIRSKDRDLFRGAPSISLVHTTNPFLAELHSGKNITVYRASPVKLAKDGMQLDTAETLPADAVIYATGWRSSIDFFTNEAEAAQLGIPIPYQGVDKTEREKHWTQLEDRADAFVTNALPQLSSCPKPDREAGNTHFRLYRQVLSPKLLTRHDRSITFVGFVSSSQTSFCSELLSLWAVSWMEDIFPHPIPTEQQMEQDVARVNAWMARRYGARGRRDPEIILEIQSFFDVLMDDLGLRTNRKQVGVLGPLKEWMLPYRARDYEGFVGEFLAKRRD